MAEKKGITIDFYGNTVEFDKSLDGVNKALKSTKSELNALNKQLKLDPGNLDTLEGKFKKLKQMQSLLKDQVELYKNELSKLSTSDVGSKQWTQLTKNLQNAELQLAMVTKDLDNLPSAKVQKLSDELKKVESNLKNVGDSLTKVGTKLSALSAGIVALGTSGVAFNAQLEQYNVALTTLTGSAEEAERIMSQIQLDAAATPFDVDSLTKAQMLLISADISAEDARNTILALGDAIAATGGGSDELSRMAQNLQQIKNVGKASAQDIKQFANAGINVYGLLADSIGVSAEEIKDMDISYEVLADALSKAAQEGGKYFGAMATQSQTLNGQISTLKDTIKQLLGSITSGLVPIVKEVISYINTIVAKINELDDAQKEQILKIAAIFAAIGPVLVVLGKVITTIGSLAGAIGKLGGFSGIITSIKSLTSAFGGMLGPIALAIGAFALAYTQSETFRETVNSLVSTLWESLKPVLEGIWDVVKLLIDIFKGLIEIVASMWASFLNSDFGQRVIQLFKNIASTIEMVIGWVKTLLGWIDSAVSWVGNLLGLQSKAIDNSNELEVGGGSSSGEGRNIDVTTNININNTGSNINESEVRRWVSVMTDELDVSLGRRI